MSAHRHLCLLAPSLLAIVAGAAGQARVRPILGKVLAENGEPAMRGEVILRWRVHPELPGLIGGSLGDQGLAERRYEIGDDGRFRIEPPHAGPFLLLAVDGAQSCPQEFPVMAGDRPVVRLEPTPWIGGKVVNDAGRAIAGAEVRLLPESQGWWRAAAQRVPERRAIARTEADGSFRRTFEGGYLRGPRWGVFVFPWVCLRGYASPVLGATRPCTANQELCLQMKPFDAVSGQVLDALSGKPVAGATLVDTAVPGRAQAADAEGRFRIDVPFLSGWVVAEGHAPAALGDASPKHAGMQVRLQPGATLAAVLVDAKGEPLRDARVLFAAMPANGIPLEWHARTDDEGKVATKRAPRDLPLLAFVERDGVFVRFYRGRGGATDLGRVTVAPRALVGRVLSAQNLPLAGARVSLLSSDAGLAGAFRTTYTDRVGRFRFEGRAADEALLTVNAGVRGLASVRLAATPQKGELRVTIPNGDAVRACVVDDRGEAVAGAWVTLWRSRQDGDPPGPQGALTAVCGVTDVEGRVVFRGLDAGVGWTVQSKYLRDGVYWRSFGSANATGEVRLVSTQSADGQ